LSEGRHETARVHRGTRRRGRWQRAQQRSMIPIVGVLWHSDNAKGEDRIGLRDGKQIGARAIHRWEHHVRDVGGRRFKSCHSDQHLAQILAFTAPIAAPIADKLRAIGCCLYRCAMGPNRRAQEREGAAALDRSELFYTNTRKEAGSKLAILKSTSCKRRGWISWEAWDARYSRAIIFDVPTVCARGSNRQPSWRGSR
jgi:hypothetical protein